MSLIYNLFMYRVKSSNGTSHWLALVFTSIFLVSLGMISHNVFAMGPPHGTCNNEYDGPFINATIAVGNQTYYPMKNNVNFQLTNDKSYDVTFTIKTPSQNNQGNSLPGTVWVYSNAIGYDNNYCLNTANPNQNFTYDMKFGFPRDYNPSITNNITVYWSAGVPSADFSYTIQWVPPTTQPSVPSAPQNLQTNTGNSQIALSWSAPSSNGGSTITGYNIYRGTTSGSEGTTPIATVNGTTLTYTDTGLTNGPTYFYKVTAINSIGMSPQSNEANATPTAPATSPQPPTGLTTTTISSSQINLSWTAPSDNGGSAITGYQIERSTDNGNTWSTIQSNTGSTTTYSDTGLSPSTSYTYRVSAINSVGTSSPSNTASATTSAITPPPTGIVLNNIQSTSGAASSSNQITLANFDTGTGNNKLLVVGVSANNNDVASVTFGGVSLTNKVKSFYNNDAEFWYLKNPTGTGDIVVTMNGPTSAVVGAYSFSGVNQTSPLPTSTVKHNTTPNSPNITITTKFANDWVLDLPSIYGGSTLGSPTCTQQWDVNVANAITGASSSATVATPGSVTCKWTASSTDFWDDAAIEIKASK
jgi:hypothetical protein